MIAIRVSSAAAAAYPFSLSFCTTRNRGVQDADSSTRYPLPCTILSLMAYVDLVSIRNSKLLKTAMLLYSNKSSIFTALLSLLS